MRADHLGLDRVPLQELERLRVVACRDLDLVAALAQQRDQRPEHQHVGRRRDVDPHLHSTSASSLGSRSAPGARSTCRSCQSVNASRPQSWRLRSSRPATWSSISRVTASGRKKPWRRSVSAESVSRANGSRSPAQPGRGRDREAALAPAQELGRDQRRGRLAQEDLLAQPAHLVPVGEPEREVRHDRVEERDARLERVRHRRAVGLHEQVVDEVRAEVDVLEPREQLGALGLREARAQEVDRVGAVVRRPVSSARASGEKISFQP